MNHHISNKFRDDCSNISNPSMFDTIQIFYLDDFFFLSNLVAKNPLP